MHRFLVPFAAASASLAAAQQPAPSFHVEKVGDGVYAIARHEPEAFGNNANSLVVVGDSGVLVVDAQFTRQATLETIAAIRNITRKPVMFLVNSHWHDDHVGGNMVYRDSFPNVRIISSTATRHDLATLGADNRKSVWVQGTAYTGRFERLMSQGLGFDSTAIAPDERAALSSTVAIIRRYVAEAPQFREELPDVTFDKSLTVYLGSRAVEIHWYGRGNTAGDAVTVVPDAKVVATGDLLVAPMPFAFNSFVGDWIATLDSVKALQAAILVPGHGPVMRDDKYLLQVQRMLRLVRDEARAAVARGDSASAIRRAPAVMQLRNEIAGDDKWRRILFNVMFLNPAAARAYEEALKKPAP